MQIVYLSIIGNTRRFVEKLNLPSMELDEANVFTEMTEDFILITPTYAIEMTDIINDFLETGNNLNHCQGVIGGGNRNFNDLFCFTAYDLALDYDISVLHTFEFMGSDNDVTRVKELVKEIENTYNIQKS